MLKTTATKIKAAKKNISVQFMNDDEYSKIFISFLEKLKAGNIKLKLINTNLKLRITLENPLFKNILAYKLKKVCKDSFDYTSNKEVIEVDYVNFIKMLKNELTSKTLSDDLKTYVKDIVKKVEKEHSLQNVSDFTSTLLDTYAGNVATLTKKFLNIFKEAK